MKKLSKLLILLFALCFLCSCDNWYYASTNNAKYITKKTTYNSFSYLKAPILISMTVKADFHLFGSKALPSKSGSLGDIILILDPDTETVFDWVFNPQGQGFSDWRLFEYGKEKSLYCQSCPGSETIAIIDPEKTKLEYIKTGMNSNLWSQSEKTDYGAFECIYRKDGKTGSAVRIVDVKNKKMGKYYFVDTLHIGSTPHMRCDTDDNMWFVYHTDKSRFHIAYVDCKNEELHDKVLSFKNNEDYTYDNGVDYVYTDIENVTDEYLIIAEKQAQTVPGPKKADILFYNRKVVISNNAETQVEPIKIITIQFDDYNPRPYLYRVEEVNEKFYAICPSGLSDQTVYFFELDLETETAIYKNKSNFDMTEDVYVRDNKIYLMNSRKINDISYLYYDVDQNTFSEPVNVKYEDVVKKK